MKTTKITASVLFLLLILSCVISAANAIPSIKGEVTHTERTLYNGVQYAEIRTNSSTETYGAQHINVVSFDLKQQDLYVEAKYYNDTALVDYSASTVGNILKQYNRSNAKKTAVAAVNGDMWLTHWALGARGNLTAADKAKSDITISRSFNMVNGEIYTSEITRQEINIETSPSTPINSSWTFGITDDYIPTLGQPHTVITMKDVTQGKTVSVDGINRFPVNNILLMYTDRIMGSRRDFVQDDAYELLIEFDGDYTMCHDTDVTGTLKAIYDSSTSSNPPYLSNKQLVITARGNRVSDISAFKVGDKINFKIELHDYAGEDELWQRVQTAVSGSLPLAKGGVPRPEIDIAASTGYPSTIFGYNRDGKIVIVTMDGRGVGGAGGSKTRYKQLIKDLDLYDALLFDGGGSMTMVTATDNSYNTYKTVSTPSDGADRTIDNALIVAFGPKRAAQGEFVVEAPYIDTDPKNVTFPSIAYVKAFKNYENQTEATVEDGALKLSVTGSSGKTFDPYIIFDFSKLANKASADENKYLTLVYMMPTTNSRAAGKVKYYGTEVCKNYTSSNPAQFTYMTDQYEYVQFDMSKLSDWTGDITELRIDYLFASGEDGDTMYIHNIIFSKTADAGKAEAEDIIAELNKEPETDPPETDPDSPPETVKGDCNGDGTTDNKDVVTLFRYVSSGAKEEDESIYDFNGDTEVNNKDVVALFRYISAIG